MKKRWRAWWMGAVLCLSVLGAGAAWAQSPEAVAEGIMEQAEKVVEPMFGEAPKPSRDGMFLLLSLSLPKAQFQSYMEEAVKMGASVVLRGFVNNQPQEHVKLLRQKLDLSADPTPNPEKSFLTQILLDPVLFRHAEIEEVPAWVYRSGEQVAVVKYGVDGRRFVKELERLDPEFGSFGMWYRKRTGSWEAQGGPERVPPPGLPGLEKTVRVNLEGPKWKILEPDLLEVVQRRIKNKDWNAVAQDMERKAMEKIRRGPELELPVAATTREIWHDPTYVVPERIIEPSSGTVVAEAGTRVNVLEHVELRYGYVVFDPSDARQVAIVKERMASPDWGVMRLLVTRGNVVELSQEFEQAVYWATPDWAKAFGVMVVPSIVRQEGNRLRIEEVKP